MGKTLRVLNVEDSEPDAALIARHLKRAGYDLITDRVETAETMRAALQLREWDVILCDFSMPHFNAMAAVELLKEMNFDLPFIIISGTVGEDSAVGAMRSGAHDYLMKGSLTRLVPAIEREMKEAENRRARRQAEAEVRLQGVALESAANAIMITDEHGNIIWINPAFTDTTGYSGAEVIGKNPRLLKSGKQPKAFYQNMWETILAGKVWRNTIVNRRKDGGLNTEDLTITPIRNHAGEISHFIAIKQDITELQQALSDLQQKTDELTSMTQQLWQASKLATMGELAASVAHELNNPLATISLRLETLAAQLENDDQKRRSVEIVADEAERMGKLVGSLLEFSRRTHRQISTVDAREELDNSVELIEYHLRSNNVKIVREYHPNLPTIQADRQQLRQVFLNLMTNASDAMKAGGTITLRATVSNGRDGEMVRLEFEDTGGGINPENLQKIWDPFFTTKPEGKGTGLGLAICKRVIEEHHGSITIQSEEGKGTRVTLELPTTNGGSKEMVTE